MKRTGLLVVLAVAALCRATGSLVTTAHAGRPMLVAASAHQPGTPTQPLFPARTYHPTTQQASAQRTAPTDAYTSTAAADVAPTAPAELTGKANLATQQERPSGPVKEQLVSTKTTGATVNK